MSRRDVAVADRRHGLNRPPQGTPEMRVLAAIQQPHGHRRRHDHYGDAGGDHADCGSYGHRLGHEPVQAPLDRPPDRADVDGRLEDLSPLRRRIVVHDPSPRGRTAMELYVILRRSGWSSGPELEEAAARS